MDYKKVIESRYNRESWQLLLHDIFHNKVSFWNRPSEVRVSSRLAKQALNLGKISLSDGESIAVYEVELNDNVDIERNRRGIRDMLTSDWRNMGYAGAFMFCYRKNESVLRFSYVSESWSFAEDGTYKKDSTDTKRFTYLLGEGHRSRTAIQQFEGLKKSSLTLQDLTKAFSVDAVSDMFFHDYKQQYEDIIAFITGKRMVKVANKWEEKIVGEPNEKIFSEFMRFSNPEKAIRDYVKKLMGRIVFLQFLQKKGWLGVPIKAKWGEGDKEFIQNLFINTQDKDHFIDNVLEYLFNDINTERAGDLVSPEVGKDIRVPYLNGGLFEPDAADATEFPLPAKYMKSMLDFFSSYNFTIDENDPDDAEMGVDPEMLGRIFENLLEDNKDKGAFYTPKEIVAYMCRESLIAYLQTDIEKEEQKEAIRQFVTNHQFVQHLPGDILEMLKNVKICDPAIGSGAFPMGLLKELFLCRGALEGFDQKKSAEIKKHIIQQNIYGVDIEKGAVDIARLRFWLSLIVDEETPEALPNLDFKIMQGNSLLEQYKGVDLSTMTEKKVSAGGSLTIFDSMLDVYRKELRDKLALYYNCPDHNKKKELRKDIVDIVKKELYEEGIDVDFGNLDLAGNDQFFLWHTWFHDVFSRPSKEGFDIVIGNPPYVSSATQMQSSFLLEQRNRIIESRKYSTLYQKWDLYIPFMELGIRFLLRSKGIETMIVPYPLTNQLYAEKLRKIIVSENNLLEIVDLNGTKIFENATVSNCIPFIRKNDVTGIIYISNIDTNLKIERRITKFPEEIKQDNIKQIWNLSEIEHKTSLHDDLNVLGDFCYISKGMVLHSENKEFSNEDLISDTYDYIHCRKYIEAKDMDSYCIKRERFIEYNTDRVPGKVSRPTFKELYTNPKLMINCLGSLKVAIDEDVNYICQQGIRVAVLWKDLKGVNNKSISSSIKRYSRYNRTQMEELSSDINLRYLLGILNSKYCKYLLDNLRGGDYHIVPEHIRNIPIGKGSDSQIKELVRLSEMAIRFKETGNISIINVLNKIDELVFDIYNVDQSVRDQVTKHYQM